MWMWLLEDELVCRRCIGWCGCAEEGMREKRRKFGVIWGRSLGLKLLRP